MSLKQRIISAAEAFRNPPRSPYQKRENPFRWPGWRENVPTWQLAGVESYVNEGFNRNSLIYSAIMYKARQITAAKLRVYKGDEENPELADKKHPLSLLATRPNFHQSAAEFHMLCTTYLNISGNVFLLLDRKTKLALPDNILPLRPDRVRIVPKESKLGHYIYVPEGKAVKDGFPILPEDMIHIKFPNPADPLEGMGYGLSPMAPLAQSGDVDNEVTRFLKRFFEHGMMLQGILKFKDPVAEEVAERAKARWKQVYGGSENWAEIGVLDASADYQRISPTFNEMGFESIDNRNESRILAPFGVPGILLGSRYSLERSTFSNFAEARRVVWEDTLIPEQRLYSSEFDYYLTSADGAFVRYDYSEVPALQRDIPALAEAAYKFWQMGVPVDQAFAMAGLQAETVPGGKRVYVTTTVALAGEVDDNGEFTPVDPDDAPIMAQMDVSDEMDGEGSDTEEPDEPPVTDEEEDETRSLLTNRAASEVRTPKNPFRSSLDHLIDFDIPIYEERARLVFEKMRREIQLIVSNEKRALTREKRSVKYQQLLQDVLSQVKQSGDDWREKFYPILRGSYMNAGEIYRFANGINFNLRNLEGEAWFRDYTLKFADPISVKSRNEMREIISAAMNDGSSIPEIQKQIDATFDVWMTGGANTPQDFVFAQKRRPDYRTELIARTEVVRASNAGAFQAAKAWGAGGKEWLSTNDARTRDSHRAADGQRRSIDDTFDIGGHAMLHPGDMTNGAPLSEVANCRCTVLPGEPGSTVDPEKQTAEPQAVIEKVAQQDQAWKKFGVEYLSDPEMRDYAQQDWEFMQANLTSEERARIRNYTFQYDYSMNKRLRSGYLPTDIPGVDLTKLPQELLDNPAIIDDIIEEAKNGLHKGGARYDMIVRRPSDEFMNGGDELLPQDVFEALPGQIIGDDGFTSTTLKSEGGVFSGKTYEIELRVPKGTPGLYIRQSSHFDKEEEFLMAPGTRWRVLEAITKPGRFTYSPVKRKLIVEVVDWPGKTN